MQNMIKEKRIILNLKVWKTKIIIWLQKIEHSNFSNDWKEVRERINELDIKQEKLGALQNVLWKDYVTFFNLMGENLRFLNETVVVIKDELGNRKNEIKRKTNKNPYDMDLSPLEANYVERNEAGRNPLNLINTDKLETKTQKKV